MDLTIVYDNETYAKDMGLKSDWGFSCLIETEKNVVLFDAGAKGEILLNNMKNLGINPKDVNKIVISHEHWDHNGGLKKLAEFADNVEIYRLEGTDSDKKMHINYISDTQEITDDVFTTGRLKGTVDEQSLVLKGKNGWYVLVGCSHPGVENILDAAKQIGNVVGLIGGFHGFNDFAILDDLDFVCPCHCTQHKKRIKELYPTKHARCGAGRKIKI